MFSRHLIGLLGGDLVVLAHHCLYLSTNFCKIPVHVGELSWGPL